MPPRSDPLPLFYHSSNSSDEYIDALDSVTGLSPSANDEMHEYLAAQVRAEQDPSSSRNAKQPALTPFSRTRALTRRFRSSRSMDGEILRDPVKRREVREIANFKEHGPDARKRRYKRRWDKPVDADLSEIVQYTGDDEADQSFKEEHDRRNFELARGLVHERDQYDDCFVLEDDPEGWVYIDRVTVPGGYAVQPTPYSSGSKYSLSGVKKAAEKVLGWSG